MSFRFFLVVENLHNAMDLMGDRFFVEMREMGEVGEMKMNMHDEEIVRGRKEMKI